jgi:hypothetical protein
MPTINEILDSIDSRLRDLNEQIDALTAARTALDGNDAQTQKPPRRRPSTAGPPRVSQRRRRPKRVRAVEVVPAGKLELLLAESDGLTTSALAEKANGARAQVLILLRELETAGRIRRTGERRSTRWHVITDEERIQARAAELAAQSKLAST